jgi:hypothetical protein
MRSLITNGGKIWIVDYKLNLLPGLILLLKKIQRFFYRQIRARLGKGNWFKLAGAGKYTGMK